MAQLGNKFDSAGRAGAVDMVFAETFAYRISFAELLNKRRGRSFGRVLADKVFAKRKRAVVVGTALKCASWRPLPPGIAAEV